MMNININDIVEEIIEYFGNEHREFIENKYENTKIIWNDKYEEPVCVKRDGITYIIVSNNIVNDKCGNIILTHMLLHALGEESLVIDGKAAFNEIVVDYMANDISKKMEEKGINVTGVENPIYESNSYYASYFSKVELFYKDMKKQIISSRISGSFVINDKLKEAIYKVEEIFDSYFTIKENDYHRVMSKR